MKTITLDGERMTHPDQTVSYLKEAFGIEHSGDNLDAIWDILSSSSQTWSVILINEPAAYHNLGGFADRVIRLLNQLNIHNPNFSFDRE